MVIQSAVIDGDRHGDIDDDGDGDDIGEYSHLNLTELVIKRMDWRLQQIVEMQRTSHPNMFQSIFLIFYYIHITTNHMLQPIRLPQLGW